MKKIKKNLTDLPTEILDQIVGYLRPRAERLSLSRVSRKLHGVCLESRVDFIDLFSFRVTEHSSCINYHLMFARGAQTVGKWAIECAENESKLQAALRGGVFHLLELRLSLKDKVRLSDIIYLHSWRVKIIQPLAELLHQEDYRRNRGAPIELEKLEIALMKYWVYCELFHHSFELAFEPDGGKALSDATKDCYLTHFVDCGQEYGTCRGFNALYQVCNSKIFQDKKDMVRNYYAALEPSTDINLVNSFLTFHRGIYWLYACVSNDPLQLESWLKRVRKDLSSMPRVDMESFQIIQDRWDLKESLYTYLRRNMGSREGKFLSRRRY